MMISTARKVFLAAGLLAGLAAVVAVAAWLLESGPSDVVPFPEGIARLTGPVEEPELRPADPPGDPERALRTVAFDPEPSAQTGGGLCGRLVGARDSAPLAGLEVLGLEAVLAELAHPRTRWAPAADSIRWSVAARATSDGEGRFRLGGLRRAARHAILVAPGTTWARRVDVEDPVPREGLRDLGDLSLDVGVVVQGRIVDPTGAALAGAHVRVRHGGSWGGGREADVAGRLLVPGAPHLVVEVVNGAADDPAAWHPDAAMSAPDGRFSLVAVPGQGCELEVEAPGFARLGRRVALQSGGTTDLGDLQLAGAVEVRGRVVDDGGRGVAGAWVCVASGGMPVHVGSAVGHRLGPPRQTATDGSFHCDALEEGPIYLAFRRDGDPVWQTRGPVPCETDVVLALLPPASGLIVLDAGSTPLPEPDEVRVSIAPCGSRGAVSPLDSSLGFAWTRRHPERAGGLAILPRAVPAEAHLHAIAGRPGLWEIGGLPAGTYRLRIEARGFCPAGGWIRLDPEQPSRLVLPLDRQVERSFMVCDDLGAPVAGARLYWLPEARPSAGGDAMAGETSPSHQPVLLGVSGATGTVVTRELPARTPSLFAVHRDFATGWCEIFGPGSSPERIVLARLGTIEGEAVGASDTRCTVLAAPGADAGRLRVDAHGKSRRVSVDAKGRFRLDNLSPGEWWLRLLPGEVAPNRLRRSGLREPDAVRVQVDPGGTAQVTLRPCWHPADGASVEGIVRVDGQPAAGFRVVTRCLERRSGAAALRRSASARIDEGGTFRLEGLQPGWHRISLSQEESGRPAVLWSERARLHPGEVWRTSIELRLSRVLLRVLGHDGQPVTGMPLVLAGLDATDPEQPRGNGLLFRATTDADGRILLEGVPGGTYRVSGTEAQAFSRLGEELEVRGPQFERTLRAVSR